MERPTRRSIHDVETGRTAHAEMNRVLQKSSSRVLRHPGFWMALLIICASIGEAQSQRTTGNNDTLPPPRSNLVSLHWPDLTTLEAVVREQLLSAQKALTAAATIRDPVTTDATLSEAYGEAGEIFQPDFPSTPPHHSYLN